MFHFFVLTSQTAHIMRIPFDSANMYLYESNTLSFSWVHKPDFSSPPPSLFFVRKCRKMKEPTERLSAAFAKFPLLINQRRFFFTWAPEKLIKRFFLLNQKVKGSSHKIWARKKITSLKISTCRFQGWMEYHFWKNKEAIWFIFLWNVAKDEFSVKLKIVKEQFSKLHNLEAEFMCAWEKSFEKLKLMIVVQLREKF